MSNLKKVLALVLAVGMLLSFGITAGAGAFSDVKDDDDYARAINLLASLDVLKGFDDGTYQALGTYTREQFAKILYVLMNGKDDLGALYLGAAPFPDVAADRWSAGYITWAKNANIIIGREDGLFWPTDIVTYAEAAKMFVVAMGYDSTVYTFPYGFIDKAQTLKLFDDVKGMTTNGPANRGSVAQMGFNALFAEAPRFGTYAAQVGTSSTTETKTKTVAMGAFGMYETYGYLAGTSSYALGVTNFTDDGQVAIASAMFEDEFGGAINGTYDYDGNVDEYVGSKVVIWYREAKSATGSGDDSKEKIFDIQPADSNRIYEFGVTDIKGSKTNDEKFTFSTGSGEKSLKVGTTGIYDSLGEHFPDGDDDNDCYCDLLVDILKPDAEKNDFGSGTKIKAIDFENDGWADFIVITFSDTAEVTGLTASRITFANTTPGDVIGSTRAANIKDDDVVIYNIATGIAKEDYVHVSTRNMYTDSGVQQVFDVAKATKVSDVKLTDVDGGEYILGGKVYEAAPENDMDEEFDNVSSVGNTYDIVLNANGEIVFCAKVASSVSSDKWLLVTAYKEGTYWDGGAAPKSELTGLTGYTSDGTKKTYALDEDLKLDGEEIDLQKVAEYKDILGEDTEKLYQFALNSDGEIKTLKSVEYLDDDSTMTAFGSAADATYKTSSGMISAGGSAELTDDSVIYVKYGSKYKVLNASEVSSFDNGDGFKAPEGLKDKNNDAVVLLITHATKQPIKSTDKFGYILYVNKSIDSNEEYTYTFWMAMDGAIKSYKTAPDADESGEYNDLVTMSTSNGGSKTVGFARVSFDVNNNVDSIEQDITEWDVQDDYNLAFVAVTDVKTGALIGRELKTPTFAGEGGGYKYNYTGAFESEATYDFTDSVNYYLFNSYPVYEGNGLGIIEADKSRDDYEVASKSDIRSGAIDEEATDINVVALILDDDGDVESVYIFSDALGLIGG